MTASVELLDADRPQDAERWTALAEASPLCDVGFRPGFVKAHQLYPEASSRALLVTAADQRFLIPLLFKHMEERGGCYDTHTASNIGGILPVDRASVDRPSAVELVRAVSEWSRRERVVAHFVTLHPGFDQLDAFTSDEVRAVGGFRLDRPSKQAAIPLAEWDEVHDAPPRIKWERRRDLKRARAELRLEWVDAPLPPQGLPEPVRVLTGLYRESLERLKANEHWFYPDAYFRVLLERLHDQVAVALIRRGDETVAAFTLLIDRHFAHGHLIGSTELGRKLGAATLMYVECARLARERGCRMLMIGSGLGDGDSVWQFKTSFRPVELPDATLAIVPDRSLYEAMRTEAGDSMFTYPPLDAPAAAAG